jgi:site-specific DNA recombinase
MTVEDFYARKSSADLGRSVAKQERLFRADCATEDFTPGRMFVDPEFSASRYAKKERPDFQALLEHIRAARCEMLAMWEVTRGSRQMGEWVMLLDITRAMGVLIRIIGEGGEDAVTYDPRRQRDREFLMREAMAGEGEVEKTRTRTKQGAAIAASEGRPHGFVKDGYRRVYGDFMDSPNEGVSGKIVRRREVEQVIDEPRAQIYRWAAEGLLNDVPADRIAAILMAFEVPTPRGKGRWIGSSIVKAVLSSTLEGHRVANGKIVKRNAWPFILDEVTAARLRVKFADPSPRWKAQDTRLKHWLVAAILCEGCGTPMGARENQYLLRRDPDARENQVYRYECTPDRGGCGRISAPMKPLEQLVERMMRTRLRQPDALALFEPGDGDEQLRQAEAEAELDLLTARRDELYAEAARPGGPSMALIAATESRLLPQIEEADARARALRTPPALRTFDPVDLAENWPGYSVGDRRTVTLSMAEIVVSPTGRGRRWGSQQLASSRWRGADRTWGESWAAGGYPA